MRLSQSGSLTAILFLLTPQTLAQKTPLEFTRGTRLNDPFCLSDGQDGETRILTPGDLSGSCDALAADQTANCYWASNVWAAQHQLDQVFQGSSSNTCGHCTTNFTCFEVSSNGREIFGAGPETYNDVQVTADEIFLG